VSVDTRPSTEAQPGPPAGGLAGYFKFDERGTDLATEARAGLTTFMVMAYILFLNGNIIAKPLGLDPVAVSAGTALIAGIMTIAMGVVGNYPLALAAGLGINAIVAFSLTAKGLDAKGAMGVIVIEGVIITVLVAVGLREAIMNAVPIALKRAIGVGIGLFILFIGFANGGLIVSGCGPDSATLGFCNGTLVTLAFPTTLGQLVFIIGLVITFGLYALRIRAALIISIIVTTIIAILLGVQKVDPTLVSTPSFSTVGLGLQDPFQVFAKLGVVSAILTIFAIMLSDFFDTMGTVTGIAAEAGLAGEDGSVPGIGRVLRRVVEHDLHRERGRRGRGWSDRLRVGRHRHPVPARDLPLPDRRADPVTGHGTGPRAGRLPDVHARQGHPGR